jgi:ribonuclease P protein component
MTVERREPSQRTTRLGITASRRVGPAVVRSLVKRRIREWFRRHRGELPVNRDIVVIARGSMAVETPAILDGQLSAAAAKLTALLGDPPVRE